MGHTRYLSVSKIDLDEHLLNLVVPNVEMNGEYKGPLANTRIRKGSVQHDPLRTLVNDLIVYKGNMVRPLCMLLNCLSIGCLLYTSPSPRDGLLSRMPSSA